MPNLGLYSISEVQSNLKLEAYHLCTARRTPSISAPRNYVYKHVYIYFLVAGQARAVGSLESGNPLPLCSMFLWPRNRGGPSVRCIGGPTFVPFSPENV